MASEHKQNLLELIKPKNLIKINEHPRDLQAMIIEPCYYNNGMAKENKCPDLFLEYVNGLWSIIELKHTTRSRNKARIQIESGYEFLHDVFNIKYDDMTGKLVTYEGGFKYERIR